MIALSPAARRGIFHTLIARAGIPEELEKRLRQASVTEVVRWRCNICRDLHDDEDDAAECCSAAVTSHAEELPNWCPVCGKEATSPHAASDCCLWKDIDANTRWRMADQVEAGSTWKETLGVQA